MSLSLSNMDSSSLQIFRIFVTNGNAILLTKCYAKSAKEGNEWGSTNAVGIVLRHQLSEKPTLEKPMELISQ